jgi:hypothetical protein
MAKTLLDGILRLTTSEDDAPDVRLTVRGFFDE